MKFKFLFSSLAMIALGVLFIIYQGGVFDLMIKVFAVILGFFGLIDFLRLHWLRGAVKIALGVAIWFLGWKFMNVALYVVGGLLILYGLKGLWRGLRRRRALLIRLVAIIAPMLCIAVGCFLIFGQGVVLSWVFVATGISLVVSGLLSLVK